MKRHEAIRMREIIEMAMVNVADKEASEVPTLFPSMQYNGELIKAGTRIYWNGTLKRAAVDLWNIKESNPENAPTLWEDIAYKEGHRIIPATITAGTAFAKNELGWWNNELYKSLIEANVYTPEQYAAGWEKQ